MNQLWLNIWILVCIGYTCSAFPGREIEPIYSTDDVLQVNQNGKFQIVDTAAVLNQRESKREDSLGATGFIKVSPSNHRERDSKVFNVPADVIRQPLSPDRREVSRDFLLETLEEIFQDDKRRTKNLRKRSPSRNPIWEVRNNFEEEENQAKLTEDTLINIKKLTHHQPPKQLFTKTKGIPVWTHNSYPSTRFQPAFVSDFEATRNRIYGHPSRLEFQEYEIEKANSPKNKSPAEILTIEKEIAEELKDVESFVDLPHLLELVNPNESDSAPKLGEIIDQEEQVDDTFIFNGQELPVNQPTSTLESREQPSKSDGSIQYFFDLNNQEFSQQNQNDQDHEDISKGSQFQFYDIADENDKSLGFHQVWPPKLDESNDQHAQIENFVTNVNEPRLNNEKPKRNIKNDIHLDHNRETKSQNDATNYRHSSFVGASHRNSKANLPHANNEHHINQENMNYYFFEEEDNSNKRVKNDLSEQYGNNNNHDSSPPVNYLSQYDVYEKPSVNEDQHTKQPEYISSPHDQNNNFDHRPEHIVPEIIDSQQEVERNPIYIRDQQYVPYKTNVEHQIGSDVETQFRPQYEMYDQVPKHQTTEISHGNSKNEENKDQHQFDQHQFDQHQFDQYQYIPEANFEHQDSQQHHFNFDADTEHGPQEQHYNMFDHRPEHRVPEKMHNNRPESIRHPISHESGQELPHGNSNPGQFTYNDHQPNYEDTMQYLPQNRQKDNVDTVNYFGGSPATGFITFNMGELFSETNSNQHER